MNPLVEAADEIGRFLSERRWKWCVIGGLAVLRWGEPRTTLDADLTLLADWGEEERYVDALLGSFRARMADARDFALSRRVLLIRSSNGTDVDVSLGALPFEVEMVERAVPVELAPGAVLRLCTAEDLFVLKAFAARPKDWIDLEAIVARNPDLDREAVLARLAPLCELKEAPEIVDRARRLLETNA